MGVIRTDRWLLQSYNHPIAICEKIKDYFDVPSAYSLYKYLRFHGMYRPSHDGEKEVLKLQKKKVWEKVQKDLQILQRRWAGPDIPIFIFPVDRKNPSIHRHLNGKSGLAYKDKLFLFVSSHLSYQELQALLTHEYNHVCRFTHYHKKEKDYVLLDSVIVEGLAENAVEERLGQKYLANWTSYYSDSELKEMWNLFIKPNRRIARTNSLHNELLYGTNRGLPDMLGYCVGYYLVKQCRKNNALRSKELLSMKTEDIMRAIGNHL